MYPRADQTIIEGPWPSPRPGRAAGRPAPAAKRADPGVLSRSLGWARSALVPTEADRPETAALKPASRAAARLLDSVSKALVREMSLIDANGVVIAVNPAWRRAALRTGAHRHAGLCEPYLDFCVELSPTLGRPAFRRGVEDLLAGRISAFTHHYTMAGETPRRRQARITPLSPGVKAVFVVIHEDLPEAAARARPAKINASELLAAQEEERVRIAVELHDSTCQHLTALNLGLTRLKAQVAGAGADAVLEDMSTSIGEVMKEVRVLSYLIKPAGLEQENLTRAVRGFVSGFGARTGLIASFAVHGPVDDAAPTVRHAAYRIVQEALSNVYRHARAQHADVALTSEGDVLTIRVSDDGQGIAALRDRQAGALEPGVGITGMRLRAAHLKGRVEISCPGQGTVVLVSLPALPA